MRKAVFPPGTELTSAAVSLGLDINDPSLIILLPDSSAIEQAERALAANGVWGERAFTFKSLRVFIHQALASSNYLYPLAKSILVGELVSKLSGELKFFLDDSLKKDGSQFLELIFGELKDGRVSPRDFARVSERGLNKALKAKLRDLYVLYQGYEFRLKKDGLIDDQDERRGLADSLASGVLQDLCPAVENVLIHGFLDFTDPEMRVLSALQASGMNIILTLPDTEGFDEIGARTRKQLTKWLQIDAEQNFGAVLKNKSITTEFLSFPSQREQARFAASEIKRLLISSECSPEEIGVYYRLPTEGTRALLGELKRLGVPFSMSSSMSSAQRLMDTALCRFVLDILSLKSGTFESSRLLRLLRSPFILGLYEGLDEVDSALSELHEALYTAGKTCSIEVALGVIGGLQNNPFFERLGDFLKFLDSGFGSPTQPLSLGRMVKELADILTRLDVRANLISLLNGGYYQGFSDRAQDSSSAWKALDGLLSEMKYLSETGFDPTFPAFTDFLYFIQERFEATSFSLGGEVEGGGIKVVGGSGILGSSYKYLFFLDSDEKILPAPPSKDPILKNHERELLNSLFGEEVLKVDRRHFEYEELLFKTVCSSAKEQIYFGYSRVDNRGRKQHPSYLIEELREASSAIVKHITQEEALLDGERIYDPFSLSNLLYLGGLDEDGRYSDFFKDGYPGHKWAAKGFEVEALRRRPLGEISSHEGIVKEEFVKDKVRLSATRLELYGTCPFAFFAGEVLGLAEPETDDLPARTLGTINHAVLKNVFQNMSAAMGDKLDLRGIGDAEIIELARKEIDQLRLDRELPLLSTEEVGLVRKRLSEIVMPEFLRAEAQRIREGNEIGVFPSEFERRIEFDVRGVELRGIVDRIDSSPTGIFVIDYKLSGAGKKFMNYNNLQLPLYLLGLKQKGHEPCGAYYRFVEKPEGNVGAQLGESEFENKLAEAENRVESYRELINKGFFPPVVADKKIGFERDEFPLEKDDKKACRWCEFGDLCRAVDNRAGRADNSVSRVWNDGGKQD